MPQPTSEPNRSENEEAQMLYKTLEENNQLVDVEEGEDTSRLPPRVTHVRYPNGIVKRIRFTGIGGPRS